MTSAMSPPATPPPWRERSVDFVIPVRNGATMLHRCLRSIAAIRRPGDGIIVVDNGSTDGSVAVARRHGAHVLTEPALRVGALRNAGVRASRAEIVAFVDCDHELAASWLDACLTAFEDPDVAAAGAPYSPPPEANAVQTAYDALRTRAAVRSEAEWLAAGNMAVRRTIFQLAGGFDETLEACEDVDLCRALRQRGFRVLAEPGMESIHHGDPATVGAVFRGELWRGRGNLRVSTRGPITLRSVPGMLLPVVNLLLVTALVAAAAASPWVGPAYAAAAVAVLAAIALARFVVMLRRRPTASLTGLVMLAVVACAYEMARALAPLLGASHATRTGPSVHHA